MIYLRAVNKVERTDDGKSAGSAKNPLEAFAVSTPERVYVICGNSEQEAVSWVDTIRAALPNNGVGLQAAEVVKAGYLTKQGGSIKVCVLAIQLVGNSAHTCRVRRGRSVGLCSARTTCWRTTKMRRYIRKKKIYFFFFV